MDENIEFILIASVILLAVGFASGILYNQWTAPKTSAISVTSSHMIVRPEFMEIAKENIAAHNSSGYNCVNYSRSLMEKLDESGYSARIAYGWLSRGAYCEGKSDEDGLLPLDTILNTSCAEPHAWVIVEVPVDAVTGKIIKESD